MVSLRVYPSVDGDRAPGADDYLFVDTENLREATRGSAGNVLAALASFFLPGLGQLVQGRLLSALFLFLSTSIGYALWFLILPGLVALVLHVVAIVDAANWKRTS